MAGHAQRQDSNVAGSRIARLCVVAAYAILSACASGLTAPTVALNQEFTLAPDGAAKITGTALAIRFLRVEGDSRCPADAVCIQGGDAIVKIEAIDPRGNQPYDLHTGSLRPVTHEGLTITLVQLAPYPFSSRTIAPGDYRATLVVSR